ncbi:hypothetical protein B0T14DRAFT_71765 [Immersiella caudata]|uniref:Uncharacterized protein n=1 Tax=Immersiella caudata TaxID=314043 RepID=A0AA39XH35_9PEZI|nr:hypothetical protein B0T14DRAFT_71765 [Immersiella caudata]
MQFVAATSAIGPKGSSFPRSRPNILATPNSVNGICSGESASCAEIASLSDHYCSENYQLGIDRNKSHKPGAVSLSSFPFAEAGIGYGRTRIEATRGVGVLGMEGGQKILAMTCPDKTSKRPREWLSLSEAPERPASVCTAAIRGIGRCMIGQVVFSLTCGQLTIACRSRITVTATGVSGVMGRYPSFYMPTPSATNLAQLPCPARSDFPWSRPVGTCQSTVMGLESSKAGVGLSMLRFGSVQTYMQHASNR